MALGDTPRAFPNPSSRRPHRNFVAKLSSVAHLSPRSMATVARAPYTTLALTKAITVTLVAQ